MKLKRFGKRRPNLNRNKLRKLFRLNKKHPKQNNALPAIYSGNWKFIDERSSRTHHLLISSDLAISLDGRSLPGSVLNLSQKELVFLDTYGYHLRIDAVDDHPISVYDEADNRVYQLSAARPSNH